MSKEKTIFSGSKEYLEKSFIEELNYKIWSTKGARFEADKRLTNISKISNISLSILSSYLIIASLISVYNLSKDSDTNLLSYVITALSIIVLVLTQYENSQDYKLRAKEFHNCGLELSVLYNKLRIYKTLHTNHTEIEARNFASDLSSEYQAILAKYENHRPIDYSNFMISHRNYFVELTNFDAFKIKVSNFFIKYGWYSLVIILPAIMIVMFLI